MHFFFFLQNVTLRCLLYVREFWNPLPISANLKIPFTVKPPKLMCLILSDSFRIVSVLSFTRELHFLHFLPQCYWSGIPYHEILVHSEDGFYFVREFLPEFLFEAEHLTILDFRLLRLLTFSTIFKVGDKIHS